MLPTEVGTFGKWLATSPLADDRIWRRDVENIGSVELQLFYARAGESLLLVEGCNGQYLTVS